LNQSHADDLNNVRREAGIHVTHTQKGEGGGENQKDRINELETNSKNKNITDLHSGINKFMSSYQPRTNTVKDEKGELDADSYSILHRWRNNFSQLLNVYEINKVR